MVSSLHLPIKLLVPGDIALRKLVRITDGVFRIQLMFVIQENKIAFVVTRLFRITGYKSPFNLALVKNMNT